VEVPALEVPARSIPAPQSVSPQARAVLTPPATRVAGALPPVEDLDTWRLIAAGADKEISASLTPLLAGAVSSVRSTHVGGVPAFEIVPEAVEHEQLQRIHLEIHGGGFVFGAGDACRDMGRLAADRLNLRTLSLDYRMPPDHPYPAALDDCLTAYRALLESYSPQDIVVSGGSAGANLVAALMLRARDEGLALPAGVLLFTPGVDLTESGDSFRTNLGVDTVLTRSTGPMHELYAAGNDLTHPYLSPLFGEFSTGFPPTFLQTGTRDLLLSSTVRMHRRLRDAGIEAELLVFEAMPHGGFPGAPEDQQLTAEVRRFLRKLWN
jgi:acetyl esterase/lipase